VRVVYVGGRREVSVCTVSSEARAAFVALEALHDGYEFNLVVHEMCGTLVAPHRARLERVIQADAQPLGRVSLAREPKRN
jgi:hypothetical protein